MNTHFKRFIILAVQTMAGEGLKNDANNATSCFLEDFDDVFSVCGFVRWKSELFRILGL